MSRLTDMAKKLTKHGEEVKAPDQPTKASETLSEISENHNFDALNKPVRESRSKANQAYVREMIVQRWGEEIAENYVPGKDVRPITGWLQAGFIRKEGERPFCFITNYRGGYPVATGLYHALQVTYSP